MIYPFGICRPVPEVLVGLYRKPFLPLARFFNFSARSSASVSSVSISGDGAGGGGGAAVTGVSTLGILGLPKHIFIPHKIHSVALPVS